MQASGNHEDQSKAYPCHHRKLKVGPLTNIFRFFGGRSSPRKRIDGYSGATWQGQGIGFQIKLGSLVVQYSAAWQ